MMGYARIDLMKHQLVKNVASAGIAGAGAAVAKRIHQSKSTQLLLKPMRQDAKGANHIASSCDALFDVEKVEGVYFDVYIHPH